MNKGNFVRLNNYIKAGLSLKKFIYYNFFCKHISREKKSWIIPYKGAVINFDKGSQLKLKGVLEIGFNRLKGSKSETYVRLDENATWNCNHGALLFYGTTVDIKKNAVFNTGFFSANTGCVLIVHKMITLGEDVMMGRNIMIYDSDHHQLRNKENIAINPPKPVIIEDHVWLTANINVLKGVKIGRDSLIANQTVVNRDVPEHSVAAGAASATVIKDYVNWDRKPCPME